MIFFSKTKILKKINIFQKFNNLNKHESHECNTNLEIVMMSLHGSRQLHWFHLNEVQ